MIACELKLHFYIKNTNYSILMVILLNALSNPSQSKQLVKNKLKQDAEIIDYFLSSRAKREILL